MTTFKLINNGIPDDSFRILEKALERNLRRRGCDTYPDGYEILVGTDPSIGDGYEIAKTASGASVKGGSLSTAVGGVGRLLSDSSFDGKGGFTPCALPISHKERCPLRGMYFATHFHNFYHEASIEEVYEVIDDLALRDCNSLLVWFDMHHYTGIDQPEAVEMIARLKKFLSHAKKLGMKPALTMLANEAFIGAPDEMKATNIPQNGYKMATYGFYKTEICPSAPGGTSEILRQRKEVMEAFADAQPEYVVYWPYDQGGCTCEKCAPWGSNGFLKLLPGFTETVKSVCPDIQIIISTWYFDRFVDGEWDGFYARLKNGEFRDNPFVMSFFFNGELPECIKKGGLPENVRFIDFPEISMYTAVPWGAFGSNPLTRFMTRTINGSGHLYSGGYPYSEGIFEDINKWICLCNYSGRFTDPTEAVKAYCRYEFCCPDEALADAVIKSETALARKSYAQDGVQHYDIADTSDVKEVFDTIAYYDRILPECVRTSRNWRLIYCRAVIDFELARTGGVPSYSHECEERFMELFYMYHAQKAISVVRPPLGV